MYLALFTYQQVNQFDRVHILTILICFLCFFLIPFFGKKLNTNKRRVASTSLIFIGLLQEVFDYGNRIYFSELNWFEDLPLHICNYVFYIGLMYMWTKKQFLFEIVYLLGLGAAFITILTPEFKMINTFEYILFFVAHALIVVFALWGIFIDGKIPRKGSVLKVYVFLSLMALPVGLISWITGGNYMFLMQRPDVSNPIVFGEWPWYILNISFIGLLIMTIAYLPFKLTNGLRVKN